MGLSSIAEAIKDIKEGKFVININRQLPINKSSTCKSGGNAEIRINIVRS